MKRVLKNSAFAVIFFLSALIGCKEKQKGAQRKEGIQYTCPMHPDVISDSPGQCPICGMDLVPSHNHSASDSSTVQDSLKYLLKPTDQVVVSDINTIRPQKGSRYEDEVFNGVINYNTRNLNMISSRVSGRIEKLYIKYNFQKVAKGSKLMDVYSPDLVNAQQELLFLKDNADAELLNAAKQKLRLLGATDRQISDVLWSGKVTYRFSIYSSYSGYITETSARTGTSASTGSTMISSADAESSSGSMGSMGAGSSNIPAPQPEVATAGPVSVTEGQYIASGQKLFNVLNDSEVWAEFYARSEQLPALKRGKDILVSAPNSYGLKTTAKIVLVQPYYKEGTNFSLIRAAIRNTSRVWKPGQLIEVRTTGKNRSGNWLPRTAVLELGSRQVVFLKKNGVFVPDYVTVLGRAGDWLDVGTSISSDTELADNAWFLVDTESFVKVKK
ncbi:multidrug efflux pump subunit AcrA (membrane-fusion protein) [Arcticibacter tournemirensis]|uniref:Efflux RND transporter periplasmic adaptor subunit n=1 Tax=Arcticibacter tournemirensis TaxID=699437 RepID=A0A5M9HI10_9SPHI|nr:efflux RND transporter periplasmic adaptor subunit [Arcticibacter tournemirensis]KAA8486656.1 efflux RND transporter periplasmic adaptor subunit [Arcticibacter tournemirensis]TQM49185.1 multidrug efflux pump subunit AcrA (membrane-fusion protein) [Arcticibacter tournemirensis]